MIQLINVYEEPEAEKVLFDLLLERTQDQSISHKSMPTFEEHCAFVRSKPYKAWYLIRGYSLLPDLDPLDPPIREVSFVGSTYLTHNHEIGLFIFNAHKRKGYGQQAFTAMRCLFPGKMFANINPYNIDSQRFFCSQGAKLVQLTYRIPAM